MKAAIMQPYIFPYIGYFQLINAVDEFIIYDDVNYINRGWINRNNILVAGKKSLFSIPLTGASQNKKIRDIKTENKAVWAGKLLKSLTYSYKKAPYFNDVFSLLEAMPGGELREPVSVFNFRNIQAVCNYLGITTKLIPSSAVFNNETLKGQDRILDICRQSGADHYINPPGGASLYEHELFDRENIKLNFLKTKTISYKQFSDDFVPDLSIIDVLMFNSKAEITQQLLQYELI